MKKILYSVMALAIAAMTFTACEDVPEPYPTPNGGETTNGAAALPYTSANLNTGWTLVEVTAGAQPWSLGQSYAQATGYQKWDGASTKSNKAVEGWLVSPAISTYGKENVKLSFNHTIKYTNNVSNWAANHKVYISTDFDGSKATWTELDFTPVASPYASSDWTLYSSGEIQLPAQFVGKEAVYIGFWFKAPADASTTWELQTFKMEEGIAENTPEPTPTEELGTAEAPLTVAKAIETINKYADNGTSTAEAYVKGTIVSVESYNSQYKSITYWISDDGTENGKMEVYSGKGLNGADFTAKTDLHKGAVVVVKGTLKKFVNNSGTVVQEFDKNNVIVSITNNEGGDTPQPTGDTKGTAASPYTVTDAIAAGSGTGVYIKAFIVGTVTDKNISSAEFSTTSASQSNILIAASANETDINKCMPVQLPSGDIRTKLNLKDNPDNYKKEVTLYGNIEKYFSITGVKSVTYAILDGTDIGKKPDGGETPSGDVKKVTIAEFNAANESNDVWYQLTGTISNLKDNDQYGNFDLTDSTGSVYVYGVLSEKGGEKKKFQTLATEKGIKNGSTITIIGNRGYYKSENKIEVTNAYFVSVSN